VPTTVRTHDFNGHGCTDIACDVAFWPMNGTTVLSTGGVDGVPVVWSIVGQRDFNGLGTVDLLWRDTGGDTAGRITWAGEAGSAVNRPFNCGRLSSTVLDLSDSTAVAIAPSEPAGCGDGAIADC
jgi:hypothetical protein